MEALHNNLNTDVVSRIVQHSEDTELLKVTLKTHNKVATIAGISEQAGADFDVADTTDNRKKIQQVLSQLQDSMSNKGNVQHRIQMHSESGRIQVALINFETGETIEEIPTSKLLKFRSELENSESLLLEEKV